MHVLAVSGDTMLFRKDQPLTSHGLVAGSRSLRYVGCVRYRHASKLDIFLLLCGAAASAGVGALLVSDSPAQQILAGLNATLLIRLAFS